VDEELQFHIEMRTRELVERGMDPKIAREVVLSRIGDLGQLKRTCEDLGRKRDREMRLTQWLDDLKDDVTVALRQLKASPAFTLVAVLTLALGIGANSAMFAVADATLLRPLPYPNADRLMMVSELRPDGTRGAANPLDFVDWSERTRTFEAMAGAMSGQSSITGADGVAQPLATQAVTSRFFDVLGVRPIVGRTFRPSDEGPRPDVVVLSEGLWRSHFGADPTLVGRSARMGGRTWTVIGVVPAAFQFDIPGFASLGRSQVWTVLNPPASRSPAERLPALSARYRTTEISYRHRCSPRGNGPISDALAEESPATNKGHRATVDPLRDRLASQELRLTSLLLLGVVAFVLLMCCANVANLLLARTSARARELAMRSASVPDGCASCVSCSPRVWCSRARRRLRHCGGCGILKAAPSLVPPGLLPQSFRSPSTSACWRSRRDDVRRRDPVRLAPAWQATARRWRTSCRSTHAPRRAEARGCGRARHRRSRRRGAAVVRRGLLLRTLLTLQNADAGNRAGEALTASVFAGFGRLPTRCASSFANIESVVRSAPGVRDVAWAARCPSNACFTDSPFRSMATRRGLRPIAMAPAIRSSARPTSVCSASPCSRDARSPMRWHQRSAGVHRGRSVCAPISQRAHTDRYTAAGERDGAAAAGRSARDRRRREACEGTTR
jgi:putative ABC transport system permease protein